MLPLSPSGHIYRSSSRPVPPTEQAPASSALLRRPVCRRSAAIAWPRFRERIMASKCCRRRPRKRPGLWWCVKSRREFDFGRPTATAARQYLPRQVTRVEPSLQAAFVEYGGNRHASSLFRKFIPTTTRSRLPIALRSWPRNSAPIATKTTKMKTAVAAKAAVVGAIAAAAAIAVKTAARPPKPIRR